MSAWPQTSVMSSRWCTGCSQNGTRAHPRDGRTSPSRPTSRPWPPASTSTSMPISTPVARFQRTAGACSHQPCRQQRFTNRSRPAARECASRRPRIVSRCHDLLVMTKAEYAAQAAAQDDWAPGWLAIDAAFESVYPGVTPRHLGSPLQARAIFGGEEYLDGISLFPSSNGYQHLLTYGMSKLYADEEAHGGDFSGWGYEMTIKVRAASPDDCWWAVNSLRNLARYTYTSKRWFEPCQFISGQTVTSDRSHVDMNGVRQTRALTVPRRVRIRERPPSG